MLKAASHKKAKAGARPVFLPLPKGARKMLEIRKPPVAPYPPTIPPYIYLFIYLSNLNYFTLAMCLHYNQILSFLQYKPTPQLKLSHQHK